MQKSYFNYHSIKINILFCWGFLLARNSLMANTALSCQPNVFFFLSV